MNAKLSVIIPVYNEEKTVVKIVEKVLDLNQGLSMEIIIVDDLSTDDTRKNIKAFIKEHPASGLRLICHDKNRGKGAALHTGIDQAGGEYLIVQDADLEYDPGEYKELMKPMEDGFADVVYGSRFMGAKPHRILFFWHSIGNRWLTGFSNLLTNLNLTDMETCYKMFRTELIRKLYLKEKGFGFEPEVTAKIARLKNVRIYEVGISYYGRDYSEGKKIKWKDGVRALYCILKYNLFCRRIYK